MSAGLSAEEWGYLIGLLRRFADSELGEQDAWRLETAAGPVYVRLSRQRAADEPAEAFRLAEPSPRFRTGRFAHAGDESAVRTREDVRRVVSAMTADLNSGGAAEWENGTLPRFLAAYGAYLADLDGYFARRGEPVPAQPDWRLLATLLVAASGYE